jgi:hypothetical protein
VLPMNELQQVFHPSVQGMLRMKKNHLLLFAVFLLVAGCSSRPANVPAKGTILMPDGKPLIGSSVVFVPLGNHCPAPVGDLLGANGEFNLGLEPGKPGLPPGEYRVIVIYILKRFKTLPARYTDTEESPWVVTIPTGGDADIVLRMEN